MHRTLRSSPRLVHRQPGTIKPPIEIEIKVQMLMPRPPVFPRRQQACAAELALNRRTAPALYLQIRGIARAVTGVIGFSDSGPMG